MARGAVLLGTGGGGDPYIGELFVRAKIEAGRMPTIIDPDELPDDAFVVAIAGIGAPTVIIEHLVSEVTLLRVLARAEALYGRPIDAIVSAEIGGANSMFPLALSAISGIPVVDADGIGRAVPHLEMTCFSIDGIAATPAILMDDSGNSVVIEAASDKMAEELCRVVTGAMGAVAFGSFYPMSGGQLKRCGVLRTLTQTRDIGRSIRLARTAGRDVFADLIEVLERRDGRPARVLFDGRIVDVMRETRDGWHWGRVTLHELTDAGQVFTVDIQNEFIAARRNDETVAIVPDLIAILDRETGEPLTGEMLAYGQRVKVIGYAADAKLRQPESLNVLGPLAFGLDEPFIAIEDRA
ncbi:DUF917 domain-containing protein [Sphingomonas sp.]|uniref:DUF917 domain-containing protein n=1 Tax=Sphingomonas sp. TaxID=28214 RepID=UPI0035BBBD12